MPRFALLAGILVFSACHPPPPPPEEEPAEVAPVSDEDSIRGRLDEYEQAYNNGDVKTLGSMFIEDGDLIDPSGNMTHGRAALEERWEKMFAGAKVTNEIEATSIRFLRPDIAIVDGTSQSFGMKSADGMEIRNVPGMYSSVWVKRNDQWMIHCLRPMIPVS